MEYDDFNLQLQFKISPIVPYSEFPSNINDQVPNQIASLIKSKF